MTNKILKFVSQMAIVGLMGFLMTSCEKNELKNLTAQTDLEQSSATTRSTVTGFVEVFNNGAWVPFEGVTVSIKNCPGVGTFTYETPGTNYDLTIPSECSGEGHPLCMEYPTITLDGVTAIDAIAVRRHVLGLTPFTTAREYLAADVNRDGKITLEDVNIINNAVLELIAEFPNDNYLFVSEEDYDNLQAEVDAGAVSELSLLILGTIGNCLTPTINDRRGIKTGDVIETLGEINCFVLGDDENRCEKVSFKYCDDGTFVATFIEEVNYVKIAEAGWQNVKWLCNSWENPTCTGTITTPLDPNQSYIVEINGGNCDNNYIDFP